MSDKKKADIAEKRRGHVAGDRNREITPREILAYHEGEMSERERDRFLDRLPFDKDAVQTLLDIENFPGENEGVEMSDSELDALWTSFKEKAEGEKEPAGHRKRTGSGIPTAASALAASFLLVALGMSFWVYSLKKENARLSAPTLESDFADVFFDRQHQRGQPDPARPSLILSRRVETFRLHLSEEWPVYGGYSLEIQDDRGRMIFSETGKANENALTLTLVREYFPGPGPYQVLVSGLSGGQSVFLQRLDLNIPGR